MLISKPLLAILRRPRAGGIVQRSMTAASRREPVELAFRSHGRRTHVIADMVEYGHLKAERKKRIALAQRSVSDADYMAAVTFFDPAAKVWDRAAEVRRRVAINIAKRDGRAQPLHEDAGQTRAEGLRRRMWVAMIHARHLSKTAPNNRVWNHRCVQAAEVVRRLGAQYAALKNH